jgi:hypothetical protein
MNDVTGTRAYQAMREIIGETMIITVYMLV